MHTTRILASVAFCAALSVSMLASTSALAGNGHGKGSGGGSASSHAAGGSGKSSSASTGTPKSVVRQYVLASGLKQGDVASSLKSWNSLNANPAAFLATLDNPNSLHGKQAAYICDSAASADALTTFTASGGDPANPPSADAATDATAYLDATALLGGLDPVAVLADPLSTPDQIAAATLITGSSLDPATAQSVVDQYNAWVVYQAADATAADSFTVASAGNSTPDAGLRATVDGVIAQKGLDISVLCP